MKKSATERKQIRTFGIGLAVFLLLAGGLRYYRGHWEYIYCFPGGSLFVLCLLLLAPLTMKPLYKAMMFVAHIIGWMNTRILLGFIFYMMFAPIGLFLRLTKKDLLDSKINKTCDTYWEKHENQIIDTNRYEQQF